MKQGTNKEIVYDGLLEYGPLTMRELSERLSLAPKSVKSSINNLDKNDGLIEVVSRAPCGVCIYKAVPKGAALTAEQMTKRIVALGGGPFGLMAAQLGVRV